VTLVARVSFHTTGHLANAYSPLKCAAFSAMPLLLAKHLKFIYSYVSKEKIEWS
jgi:hypothetical protein